MKKHEQVKEMRSRGMTFNAIADELCDDVCNVKNLYRYQPKGRKSGRGPDPEKRQMVIHYRDVGNLGWADIGRLMEITRQAAQALYQRAKA